MGIGSFHSVWSQGATTTNCDRRAGRDAATISRTERHDRLRGVAEGFLHADLERLVAALRDPVTEAPPTAPGD